MAEQQIIVVATDLSLAARAGVVQAFRIARQTGAKVHVTTVVEKDDVAGLAKASGVSREEAEEKVVSGASERLDAEIQAAAEAGGIEASAHRGVLIGRANREIVGLCKELGASLLVMGYNGWGEEHGGPGRVAASCARQAPCDVLLARAGRIGAFGRVAVAMDFSECSMLAAQRAAEFSQRDRGELVLLHAHSNPYDSPILSGNALVAMVQYQKHTADLQSELDGVADGLRKSVPGKVRGVLLEDVNPARAIAGWCKEHDTDLTVLGAMGRSALRHALMGSTADRVLRQTPSAVLVVRA